MANFKIEIIGSAVVITDTTAAVVHSEFPRRDIYYTVQKLIEKDIIYLYDTNGTNQGVSAAAFEAPLANVVDGTDTPFTVASFRAFAQENLGFNIGGGGSGGTSFKFTAVNYTDLITNVAPTADEGDLAVVYNSQGVWLVNRKLKGVYMYQSGVWEYANQELQTILQGKLDNVTAGTGISIDYTNPLEPIISAIGGSLVKPQSFSFPRNNNPFLQEADPTYQSLAKITYGGTGLFGIHTNIIANTWNDGGTSISIEIFDTTNGNQIAELTGETGSSIDNIVNLGALANLPTAPAVFEIRMLLVGGGMGDQAKISSLTIY